MLLKDRKIIITGGPTREWLDPVRFISNPSSGKMGIALADKSFERCTNTVFIHGPIDNHLINDKKYKTVSIESTNDLLNAVLDELENNSILIMAAAPSDYTPENISGTKIKKSGDCITLKLKRTPDILKNISKAREEGRFKNLFVVGFAAETNNIEEYAIEKLKSKKLEMICLNDVSRAGAGFGGDTNIITIFKKDGIKYELPMLSKEETAENIFKQIELNLNLKL